MLFQNTHPLGKIAQFNKIAQSTTPTLALSQTSKTIQTSLKKDKAIKIAKQLTTETWNKIKPKLTEAEATKMQAAGGITQADFTTLLAKGGMKPSTSSIKAFNAMDKNKDGKIDETEANAEGGGEDYSFLSVLGDIGKGILTGVGTAAAVVGLGLGR